MLAVSFFYYPKWEQERTEATISWDVAGYYWYLPSTFIYHDLKHQQFNQQILDKYGPVPDQILSFRYDNGNLICKYSSGLSVQYLPFFLVANQLAKPLGYKQDGFSKPYQLAIQIAGIMMAMLGLWFFRKMMLLYFADKIVAIVMLLYVLGTNYLNYAAIDGAMTHNFLFTWYCILIFTTHKFYKNLNYLKAIIIGSVVGLMALTRPTDIIAAIIPLLWGINSLRINILSARIQFISTHILKYDLS